MDSLIVKNQELKMFNMPPYQFDKIFNEYYKLSQKLKKYICDTSSYLAEKITSGKKVIFEGAQGVMLCTDNGTYPYVTSSSPTAASVALNTGLNFTYFDKIIGIVKSYTTRVGNGFMVSDLEKENDHSMNHIQKYGNEYGTVTGRPRRIGWLDVVALKHAIRTSGVTGIVLTMLDVLTGIEDIKIVIGYKKDNEIINYVPSSIFELQKCQPVYMKLKGWNQDIRNIKKFQNLPKNAKKYIKKIENLLSVPIKIISVGPKQSQTIILSDNSTLN